MHTHRMLLPVMALAVSLSVSSVPLHPANAETPPPDPAQVVYWADWDMVKFIGVPDPATALKRSNFRISTRTWSQSVGSRVRLEGIALRGENTGILLNGKTLSIRGEALKNLDLDGRLLRVVGVLRAENAAPGARGGYYIQVEQAKLIDRVTTLVIWDAEHHLGAD